MVDSGTDSRGAGEYSPAGENQGQAAHFSATQVTEAFGVSPERVQLAFAGEFGLDATGTINSKQAQQLAEIFLGDHALHVQQAALMTLGAYTPRADHDEGLGEKAPGEESDRLRRKPRG